MNQRTEDEVRQLAFNRCEYCHLPDGVIGLPHVLDHIIAKQHGGQFVVNNLALCCGRCNQYKGPNIASIDADTGALVPLFHPRRDDWNEHFYWMGPRLVGKTGIGRATIAVLSINLPVRVSARETMIQEGRLLT
jgi:hypothetical protein